MLGTAVTLRMWCRETNPRRSLDGNGRSRGCERRTSHCGRKGNVCGGRERRRCGPRSDRRRRFRGGNPSGIPKSPDGKPGRSTAVALGGRFWKRWPRWGANSGGCGRAAVPRSRSMRFNQDGGSSQRRRCGERDWPAFWCGMGGASIGSWRRPCIQPAGRTCGGAAGR